MVRMQYAGDSNATFEELASPFPFADADGDGTILCRRLFGGLRIVVLHLEMHRFIERRVKQDALEINFCANGRFESCFSGRDFVIMKPGDMAVSIFDGVHGTESESLFPLGHYDGLSILVDCNDASQWMQRHAPNLGTDFAEMKDRLLAGRWYVTGSAGPRCEHVFRELYENAAYFDLPYLQLKVLELFMLLNRIHCAPAPQGYCSSRQMEIVRHLRDHLISEGYASLPRLAKEQGISVSRLQKLFKQVYGAPVYHYVREYRLEQAAVELTTSARSITEIAMDAGYGSASKFSACFRQRYGTTPSEYRRSTDSHAPIGTIK